MIVYTLLTRNKILINTDSQRRCYNGCHYTYEYIWGSWEVLHSGIPFDKIERRLRFWIELNDYAVSERGESAKREFKFVPEIIGSCHDTL